MKYNRTQRTKSNMIAGIVNRVMVLILGFVVRTVMIQKLGAEYLGLSGLVTSILNILNLAESGFGSAVVFNLYKPIAEDNKKLIRSLLSFYRKVYKIIGLFILTTGLVLLPLLKYFIKGEVPADVNIIIVYLIYLANTCVGYALFAYLNVLLSAHQRNDIDSYLATATYILEYGLQISILYLFKSYYGYIIIIPLVTATMNVVRFWVIRTVYPDYYCEGELDEETKRSVYENVKGLIIQKICAATRNTFDSIFISSFVGLIAAGIYNNYFYIISSVHGILVILVTAMAAGIGNSIVVESQEKNYNDFRKFSLIYAWMAGWCTICIICNYQPFMKIWVGDKLMLPIFDVFLFGVYFYCLTIGDVRAQYSAGAGLWWRERYRSILEVVFNIILNALLGKLFGISGIIVATIITIVIINFLYGTGIVFQGYFTDYSLKKYFSKQLLYFIVVLIAFLPTYYVCALVNISGWPKLIINMSICAILPNIIILLLLKNDELYSEAMTFINRFIKTKIIKEKE